MFLRPHFRRRGGQRQAYWTLVESYRTARGPRQRTVAYLGLMDEAGRLGIEQAADATPASPQRKLFAEPNAEPRFVEIDRAGLRVENCRQFGGPWLALTLIKQLGLHEFLQRALPRGQEHIPWSLTALVLVIGRFCEPSSELRIAEHFYRQSALDDLLGVPIDKVDDNRLYRGLDALLPHKPALEMFLKQRFGELFAIEYDLLLYDVTSTYFEGQASANPLAKRGYSRDHRSDCKQVCIGLVVTRCGLPLGYEVFAGNRHDSTTLEEIVEAMEARYGQAQRIWALDRGMVSEDNLDFLKAGQRQYIVGTPKSQLKRFERQLAEQDWRAIREGLEVKLCPCPDGGVETYVLCRSRDRREKEQAMHARFEKRIEEGLAKIAAGCAKRRQPLGPIERRVGRLLGQNTRAAGLFDIQIKTDAAGAAQLTWTKVEKWRAWARLSEGSYVLRTNVAGWSDEDLWRAYIQLTEAETAFRIQKSDLSLRPVWHQKQDRVLAHLLVCFLAYVLWKFLGQLCQRAGLGAEPRRVLDELGEIRAVDVVLPTKDGQEIRARCVTQPSDHQKILLERLGWELPGRVRSIDL
jgi:transposase